MSRGRGRPTRYPRAWEGKHWGDPRRRAKFVRDIKHGKVSNVNFDAAEFESYIRDTLDGRLYWEDLIERVIQGRVHSDAFEDFKNQWQEEETAHAWSEGYEEGVRDARYVDEGLET